MKGPSKHALGKLLAAGSALIEEQRVALEHADVDRQALARELQDAQIENSRLRSLVPWPDAEDDLPWLP